MKTFLFQGDSITDTGRDKDNDVGYNLGFGYAAVTAAKLGRKYPGMRFFNKGISGNRVVDLYSRIKADFINLKPDYISILIGINDVWHEVGSQNGVSAEKYEKIYSMLVEELKEALPETKIIILEPFVLKGSATEEHWDIFESETNLRAKAAKKISEKFNLSFVPLQNKFDEAMNEYNDSSYWLLDGVHPMPAGHEIISTELIKAFESL